MDKVIRRAASGVLIEWGLEGELDDLIQDLWVWYLETPSAQEKLAGLSEPEQIATFKVHADQILSEKVLSGNVSTGKAVYSVNSVKDALRLRSTNKHLNELLSLGMEAVQHRDDTSRKPRDYAEAVRSRYADGVIPQGPDADRLSKALKSLTDEINVLFLTLNEGAGGRHSMFPNLRKPNGNHSDPTGNIACTLIDHPELREDYLEELPLDLFLKGAHAFAIRLDVQRNAWVRDVPGTVVPGAVPASADDAA